MASFNIVRAGSICNNYGAIIFNNPLLYLFAKQEDRF
jgi:hypothetical protein